jgi:hypothetical protein
VIKLSELVAARAAMTAGPFTYFERDGRIEAPGVNEFLTRTVCEMYIANHDANAHGIVATHNAADVLIEIALAALEFDTAMRAPGTRGISARRGDAAMRLHAALAKVQP